MTVHDVVPLVDSPELADLRKRIAKSVQRATLNRRIKVIGDKLETSREQANQRILDAEHAGVFARVSD